MPQLSAEAPGFAKQTPSAARLLDRGLVEQTAVETLRAELLAALPA